MISFPFAKLLSDEIHQYNPNAKIQWYQTWGRPYGDQDRCEDIPQVCTFDGRVTIYDIDQNSNKKSVKIGVKIPQNFQLEFLLEFQSKF